MAVIRVNKTDNYTIMSNSHLRDKDLSLKAKGLLSQMLSLPPNWDYTVNGLVAINSEKKAAITSTLKELQVHGYLVITKKMPNETASGRIEYVYDIYEEKQGIKKQGTEKQDTENQGLEFQGIENQPQLNTDELNTEKSSIKEKRKKKTSIVEAFTSNADLIQTINDFIEMRKEIKKPMTEKALTILLNKLKELSTDEQTQIKILNQSIEHCWQSVYPLKAEEGKNGIKLKPENERDHLLDGIL